MTRFASFLSLVLASALTTACSDTVTKSDTTKAAKSHGGTTISGASGRGRYD